MSMVFCRGCGKEIHETAPTCPHCGALQVNPSSQRNSVSVIDNENNSNQLYYFIKVLKNYAVFSGRARRKEYWMFFLVNIINVFILAFLGALIHDKGGIAGIYNLVMFIPSIAVGVRRLHDTDHSGWWILMPIVNLIFLCQDTKRTDNRFGPSPK